MSRIRQELSWKSLDQLADWMAEIGNDKEMTARAEFLRRQTLLQEESTQAAKDVAQVALETAMYTKQSARYILWSVFILALSMAMTALSNLLK